MGCARSSSRKAGSASRSGVVMMMRALPSATAASAAFASSLPIALFTCTAGMPSARSDSHWSFMSAIRGETTTVRPSSSSAGSW